MRTKLAAITLSLLFSTFSFSYEVDIFSSPIFQPILNHRIEIVNGKIKKGDFGGFISKELSDFIGKNEVIELQVRDMYMDTKDLYYSASEVHITIFYSIRFYETVITQATLDIESTITVNTIDGFVDRLENKNFKYSQKMEAFGDKLGLLNNYKTDFINLVSNDIVLPYLRKNSEIFQQYLDFEMIIPVIY